MCAAARRAAFHGHPPQSGRALGRSGHGGASTGPERSSRFGVRFIRYWYDEATGKVFCLSEAPDREAITAAHRAAHGLADEIVEVHEGV
jgi:hypothetical protein